MLPEILKFSKFSLLLCFVCISQIWMILPPPQILDNTRRQEGGKKEFSTNLIIEHRMARVTFKKNFQPVFGAWDSAKSAQRKRARLICRRHEYTRINYDAEGRKIHELYYYHFHEGPWSEGATRNREIIKAAQKAAHAIEHDAELRPAWEAAYAEYKASLPEGQPAYHFYNFVYVTIYRDLRERAD